MFILHHSVRPGLAPVAPGIVFKRCFPVAHMVVGSHDVSGFQVFYNHVEIPPGMFAEAVNQLDNSLWLRGRDIDPTVDGISFVE